MGLCKGEDGATILTRMHDNNVCRIGTFRRRKCDRHACGVSAAGVGRDPTTRSVSRQCLRFRNKRLPAATGTQSLIRARTLCCTSPGSFNADTRSTIRRRVEEVAGGVAASLGASSTTEWDDVNYGCATHTHVRGEGEREAAERQRSSHPRTLVPGTSSIGQKPAAAAAQLGFLADQRRAGATPAALPVALRALASSVQAQPLPLAHDGHVRDHGPLQHMAGAVPDLWKEEEEGVAAFCMNCDRMIRRPGGHQRRRSRGDLRTCREGDRLPPTLLYVWPVRARTVAVPGLRLQSEKSARHHIAAGGGGT